MNIQSTKIVRFAEVVFFIAGLLLLCGNPEWFPAYYRPRVMAFGAFAFIFFIELPRWVFKRDQNLPEKIQSRLGLQTALAIGLMLSGLGTLGLWGLYKHGIPYDKFVHFIFPLLFTSASIWVIHIWYRLSFKKAALIMLSIVIAFGVLWEVGEFLFAHYFHIGFFGTLFDKDSIIDVICNILGISLGVLIASKKRSL